MKAKVLFKRISAGLGALVLLIVAFTVYANVKVDNASYGKIFSSVDSIPRNRVALLLGTNPLNRWGRPNSYFTNRINTAATLYHAGKVDFIIASGDNHTRHYDEPTAMRDSLVSHGVPEERILLDFAGFRTLDSVVRAKEIFGCDSITIISQADHNARALYLAEANGINAVAISAPLRAGRWVRIRLALREWLARDKMLLDIWCGKQPHFLGDKIEIPELIQQKSYSTTAGMTIKIVEPAIIKASVDSMIVEFTNTRKEEGMTEEWFKIEKLSSEGSWTEIQMNRKYENEHGEVSVMFNAVGWIVEPRNTLRLTVRPWFYKQDWQSGTYRLAKTFHYPPYPTKLKTDTAYVEFQIR